MAKKINNSVTALGFKVNKSAPIDDRSQFLSADDLMVYTLTGGLVSLYDGLEVSIEDSKLRYKWVESEVGLFNTFNGYTDAIYQESFEYPEYAVGGVIYTGRRFNWVLVSPIVTYSLTVVATPFIGAGPEAGPLGIHIRYIDLPRHVTNSSHVTASIRVAGSTEIDLPGEIVWTAGEFVTLVCTPMYPVGTEITVKIN